MEEQTKATPQELHAKMLQIVKTIRARDFIEWIAEMNVILVGNTNFDRGTLTDCSLFLYRFSAYFMPYFIYVSCDDERLLTQLTYVFEVDNPKEELSKIGMVYFNQYKSDQSVDGYSYPPSKFLAVYSKLMETFEVFNAWCNLSLALCEARDSSEKIVASVLC